MLKKVDTNIQQILSVTDFHIRDSTVFPYKLDKDAILFENCSSDL